MSSSDNDDALGIPRTYDPQQVEVRWYRWWDERGLFRPINDLIQDQSSLTMNAEQRKRLSERRRNSASIPDYCITIPPPNVTGSLHMGHALNHSVIDALIRWHRMRGYNTLCLPGTDHAGIATQNVVEKELRKEGSSRHHMGREAFVRRVWEWVDEYGSAILLQLKRLGCSYDWNRLRFTLDTQYADAVLDVFARWWDDGCLYLGSRVINWCPRCQSVISDIEVTSEERTGRLWHIRYPAVDGSGSVTVATTRPETMLGDVAVAVHPGDERYRGMVGKTLRLPLVDREIPLIADEYPDPEFGSGAVKITPAHDPNDYEVGQRHELPMPVVLARDATVDTRSMRKEIGQEQNAYLLKYQGLDRYKARDAILEDLQALGAVEKEEQHRLTVGTCARCHTVIEPLLSEQWFADMTRLSPPATEAVRDGRIRFFPERYTAMYLHWMENLRDWPISRQLWWGHQIPAYYCLACHPEDFETSGDGTEILRRRDPIVSKSDPDECPRCGYTKLVRDPWVLDTWFSSAIWPQTTLGWPLETSDLQAYYPTNVLTTAQDIIYLWVARMIMSGLYFVGEIPFHDVYVHATVLDPQGRRMSKSLGTGVDPLDLIERHGADAVRFALLQQAGMNQDIRFSEQRVESARNFCNKIWNAARFLLINLDDEFVNRQFHGALPDRGKLDMIDRWIVTRFQRTVHSVNDSLASYGMDAAARALYEFIWSEFCDWYIEAVKVRLADPTAQRIPRTVMTYVLERALRLLHPFVPFLSEEIWQALPHEGDTIMHAPFPESNDAWIDPEAETAMALLQDATRAIRNLRAEMGITPGQKTGTVYLSPTIESSEAILTAEAELVRTFAWLEEVHMGKPDDAVKRIEVSITGADLYLPIEGVIDAAKETARLRKDRDKIETDLNRIRGKLRNSQFLERAPADVVEKERALETDLLERVRKLDARLKMFGE